MEDLNNAIFKARISVEHCTYFLIENNEQTTWLKESDYPQHQGHLETLECVNYEEYLNKIKSLQDQSPILDLNQRIEALRKQAEFMNEELIGCISVSDQAQINKLCSIEVKKSVVFGKKIKNFFFVEEMLQLKGNDKVDRLAHELEFIQSMYDDTKTQKELLTNNIETEKILPNFMKKMRSHFWNIHQFFCDLVFKKVKSEIENLKEFNYEEIDTLKLRITKDHEDKKLLISAGRERVNQLEKYIENMRGKSNQEKEELKDQILELETRIKDNHELHYLKDVVFKFLTETDENKKKHLRMALVDILDFEADKLKQLKELDNPKKGGFLGMIGFGSK